MLNDDEHQFMALLTPDSTLAANAFVPESSSIPIKLSINYLLTSHPFTF